MFPRELLLFERQDIMSGSCQQGGGRGIRGTAAYNNYFALLHHWRSYNGGVRLKGRYRSSLRIRARRIGSQTQSRVFNETNNQATSFCNHCVIIREHRRNIVQADAETMRPITLRERFKL